MSATAPIDRLVTCEPRSTRRGRGTLVVRATDRDGGRQADLPFWNEGGYANSSSQRLTVHVD